jgi:Ni,Fe-hydrogenase III large subunit
VLSCAPVGGEIPTIVDLIPAAAWAEREAHDAYGVTFAGHDPLRPLLIHADDPAEWMVRVKGHDTYQVAVGPIHAGVIESGHFRFHVVGELILHVDVRLFYKHRGLERAAEYRATDEGLAYAQRACAACSVSNTLAYAHACESALGLRPSPSLARVRTLLLELERLYNHLHDIGAICAGVGFAPGNMAFAALKERAQRVNHVLTGHRFLFDSVAVGESTWSVERETLAAARQEVRVLGDDSRKAWHEVLFNASVQDRLVGIGLLPAEEAVRLGTVGPAARAVGVPLDARSNASRLAYPRFQPAIPRHPGGDVASRVNVRAMEVDVTLALLDELLAQPVEPAATEQTEPPQAVGIGITESPRGETVCIVELDGMDRLSRLHLRTASNVNWPAVAHAAVGNLLPDFPLINKSFELCYACSDR